MASISSIHRDGHSGVAQLFSERERDREGERESEGKRRQTSESGYIYIFIFEQCKNAFYENIWEFMENGANWRQCSNIHAHTCQLKQWPRHTEYTGSALQLIKHKQFL